MENNIFHTAASLSLLTSMNETLHEYDIQISDTSFIPATSILLMLQLFLSPRQYRSRVQAITTDIIHRDIESNQGDLLIKIDMPNSPYRHYQVTTAYFMHVLRQQSNTGA
jgi:hypothetical protein